MTDRQLIAALDRDDTEALGRVMDRYGAYVATVIHNQMGAFACREDVEELTANVFTALWQSRAEEGSKPPIFAAGWRLPPGTRRGHGFAGAGF